MQRRRGAMLLGAMFLGLTLRDLASCWRDLITHRFRWCPFIRRYCAAEREPWGLPVMGMFIGRGRAAVAKPF